MSVAGVEEEKTAIKLLKLTFRVVKFNNVFRAELCIGRVFINKICS